MNKYYGKFEDQINNAGVNYNVDPCLIAAIIKLNKNLILILTLNLLLAQKD